MENKETKMSSICTTKECHNTGSTSNGSSNCTLNTNGKRNLEEQTVTDKGGTLQPLGDEVTAIKDPKVFTEGTNTPHEPMIALTRPNIAVPQMKVVFVNINGLSATKLEVSLSRMATEKIDAMCINNSRYKNKC